MIVFWQRKIRLQQGTVALRLRKVTLQLGTDAGRCCFFILMGLDHKEWSSEPPRSPFGKEKSHFSKEMSHFGKEKLHFNWARMPASVASSFCWDWITKNGALNHQNRLLAKKNHASAGNCPTSAKKSQTSIGHGCWALLLLHFVGTGSQRVEL